MRTVTITYPDDARLLGVLRAALVRSLWHVENETAQDGTVTATVSTDDAVLIGTHQQGATVTNAIMLLGVVQHGAATPVPGGTPLPHGVESRKCDVCGTARSRTHLVVTDGDNVLVVGLACFHRQHRAHFRNVAAVERAVETHMQHPQHRFDQTVERIRQMGEYDVAAVIAAAMHVTSRTPYVSRRAATRTGATATSDEVLNLLDFDSEASDRYLFPAEVLRDWAVNHFTPDSDFTSQLQRLCALDTVPRHLVSTVVYLPHLYSQAEQVEAATTLGFDPNATPTVPHLGQVGQRDNLGEMLVLTVRHLDSGSTLVKMVTRQHQKVTWFATAIPDVKEGDVVTVTGTVKKHEEYRGEASTVITRARLQR